jgi:hypothetical protein
MSVVDQVTPAPNLFHQDTIVAQATAIGKGGVGIKELHYFFPIHILLLAKMSLNYKGMVVR